MKKKRILSGLLCAALLLSCAACQSEAPREQKSESSSASSESAKSSEALKSSEMSKSSESSSASAVSLVQPYSDIRYIEGFANYNKEIYEADEFRPEDIRTFTFNRGTVLKGSEELAEQIMEAGKNPGLGVRSLHERGITGKGINVAIIDQNMVLDHPEFAENIAKYYDTGCDMPADRGSMHGPAVTSLLVGKSIGVAPEAKVYYAAFPSWLKDSQYAADGVSWIIEENKKLPEGEKIRVVSVSAAPSGKGSPFEKNLEAWDKAAAALKEEGILLLDCRSGEETGFIYPAYFDPENPEDVSKCKGGFPTHPSSQLPDDKIGVPNAYRTTAEEYYASTPSYQYNGSAGLSWSIPYAAGVLALGWQVDPTLTNDEIVQLLFDTCGTGADGSKIINPVAFVEEIEKRKK